ncbi:HNH endonuclease [Anabaena sp. FACHB-1237]|uniref:HNH endonuclease n=1 Tax=Anabaena sp. FACHB-1237 TaxID=2692769 RepID=UPI00168043A1|nr:HNH endonuclease [Anabaena sp. FACHB-1237]MBD2136605.1 HNH endonuclease [Anabaena sp. FACHB-1237]
MLNNSSSQKLLLEVVQQAPSRDWIEEYLDLVKELIDFTGLGNDDPRLVLSLAKSRRFPITINARYVLAGFRKGKPLVRFIFPYDFAEISQLITVAMPPEISSHKYDPLRGEDKEKTPYFLGFPGDPQKLLTLKQKAAWKKAILSEVERYERSPYKKFHESIVYDVVVDLTYRKLLLDQVFPVQDIKRVKDSKTQISDITVYLPRKVSKCNLITVPSCTEYVTGFTKIRSQMNELQLHLLQKQYFAPQRTVTAPELAKLTNIDNYVVINSIYGKLGHLFCEATGINPGKCKDGTVRWWTIFSKGYRSNKGFLWEMYPEVAEALKILGWVNNKEQSELLEQRKIIESAGYFNPDNIEDARKRINTSIIERQGQSDFRRKLLNAYNNKCAITGCDVESAIEAAHIIPYRGIETNHPANGLPLRADIHTLFDLHLISIKPDTYEIVIAHKIEGSCYQYLANQKLSLPISQDFLPSQEALQKHYEIFLLNI